MVSKTLPSTATPPLGAPAKYTDFKTNTYIIGFSASLYMVLLITPMITTKLVEQYSLSASAVGTLLFIEISRQQSFTYVRSGNCGMSSASLEGWRS
ncbi:TPA: hypothetical protein SL519_002062 [Pseudomonas aeruginosa]|nr:hypothetical protein [Pseudomonas aeruginosa]